MKGELRLAVAGGGTAGHVYPALVIARAWLKLFTEGEGPPGRILYLGGKGGLEEAIVRAEGIPFVSVDTGPLRGKSAPIVARSAGRTALGLGQAWRHLGRFRPQVLLATGGYASVPAALAARLRQIPIVLFLPDIRPGWAIRTLAPLARRIAATSAVSQNFLPPGKLVETGYPVREEIWTLEKQTARQRLGLSPDTPTLLVLGGSRGARRLNQAIAEHLEELLTICQVLHVSGQEDAPWLQEKGAALPGHLARRYNLRPYLHSDFPYSLAAADLALSRAGASVMGEFPAAGLPSILVPYPHAGSHQEANARFMAQAGAALELKNGHLAGLLPIVQKLLSDESRLAQMAEAARGLRRTQAAADIARLLVEVGEPNA